MQHPAVVQASVVGIPDKKYGEIVCAFLQHRSSHKRPSEEDLRSFVRDALGWHKAPVHIFWLEPNVDFPKTGSGKIKKYELKAHGENILKKRGSEKPRL